MFKKVWRTTYQNASARKWVLLFLFNNLHAKMRFFANNFFNLIFPNKLIAPFERTGNFTKETCLELVFHNWKWANSNLLINVTIHAASAACYAKSRLTTASAPHISGYNFLLTKANYIKPFGCWKGSFFWSITRVEILF